MDSSSGKKWGGSRKGAGRPPSPVLTVKLRVPREVWAIIEADAVAAGIMPEEYAARVLERHAHAPLFAS